MQGWGLRVEGWRVGGLRVADCGCRRRGFGVQGLRLSVGS